ncbi:Copia protein [Arachis hypogaea]|nr:Copia protein [Arachis hypogaea]
MPPLMCTMISCRCASCLVLNNGTKHFELDLYFVRDRVNQGLVLVTHIPASEQIVNVLTKPLLSHFFEKFRDKLRLVLHPP